MNSAICSIAARASGSSGSWDWVVVAYADWREADAPLLDDVCNFACKRKRILLIDTYRKHATAGEPRPPHLLDWLTVATATELCQRCRKAGVQVALAGSLDEQRIALLKPAKPAWFAVRGAACAAGQRDSAISVDRVQALAKTLR